MSGILNLGFIGDSITEGNALPGTDPAPVQCGPIIATALGLTVNINNAGAAGTTTGSWLPGGALNSTVSDFLAASVTDAFIMLGANDCKSGLDVDAATWTANMADICGYIAGQGIRVWLNQTIYASWDDGAPLFIPQYNAQIAGIVNGSSIRQGDATGYADFQANAPLGWQLDGIHPNITGTAKLAQRWAAPFVAYWQQFLRRPRLSFSGGRVQAR